MQMIRPLYSGAGVQSHELLRDDTTNRAFRARNQS